MLYSVSIPGIGDTFEKFITDAHFHLALGFSGYYILGYYLCHIRLNKTHRMIVYALGISMFWVTCIMEYLMDSNRIATDISVNDYLSPNIAMFSIAVFVFFTSGWISRWTVSDKKKMIISTISSCTFGVYLIHDLFIHLFESSFLFSNHAPEYIMRPIRTIVIFLLSFLLVLIIKKIPLIGRYIT